MSNRVFIATSLDGRIADKDNALDWLYSIPNPEEDDYGYRDFVADIDVIVMGRGTYEAVLGFDVGWPYERPVFVLSRSLSKLAPVTQNGDVTLMQGTPEMVIEEARRRGLNNLYIDGGKTIQAFLREDLIDEMTVTELPILLGGGPFLFGGLDVPIRFELKRCEVLNGQLIQKHFMKRSAD